MIDREKPPPAPRWDARGATSAWFERSAWQAQFRLVL